MLMTDGRVFFAGATGNTALYQAGANDTTPGTWSTGPQLPKTASGGNQGCKDGPAVLLPSGVVLFPIAPVDGTRNDYLSPATFYEFDGTNLNRSSDPPNANCPTYVGRMLITPTGQALWTREDDSGIYAFTETGRPQAGFRPVITSVPALVTPGSTITVSGRQFNGLSQANSYGDDYASATNYPLVRIKNVTSGRVRYCRTSNHTTTNGAGTVPAMGVATGNAIISTQVAIPADIELGQSELVVVANGIPSESRVVQVTLGN
jgi:hypothetical protein